MSNLSKLHVELRIGETLHIGTSTVTLEKKSGQRARLLVQSDVGIHMNIQNAGHKPNTNPSAHECAPSPELGKEHTHGKHSLRFSTSTVS